MKPRQRKFLDELPNNGYKVMPSAVKAGYSEEYARSNGRHIYKSAMKAQAKEIIATIDNKPVSKEQARQFMTDIVGLKPESVMERLRNIATQEKDYSSALKVLAPLAKELGIHLDTEDTKVTVPVLTIHTSNNGHVEPPNNPPVIDVP